MPAGQGSTMAAHAERDRHRRKNSRSLYERRRNNCAEKKRGSRRSAITRSEPDRRQKAEKTEGRTMEGPKKKTVADG